MQLVRRNIRKIMFVKHCKTMFVVLRLEKQCCWNKFRENRTRFV